MQHLSVLFQESASAMTVGQAVSWMMLGKCLPQHVSLLGLKKAKKSPSKLHNNMHQKHLLISVTLCYTDLRSLRISL